MHKYIWLCNKMQSIMPHEVMNIIVFQILGNFGSHPNFITFMIIKDRQQSSAPVKLA